MQIEPFVHAIRSGVPVSNRTWTRQFVSTMASIPMQAMHLKSKVRREQKLSLHLSLESYRHKALKKAWKVPVPDSRIGSVQAPTLTVPVKRTSKLELEVEAEAGRCTARLEAQDRDPIVQSKTMSQLGAQHSDRT